MLLSATHREIAPIGNTSWTHDLPYLLLEFTLLLEFHSHSATHRGLMICRIYRMFYFVHNDLKEDNLEEDYLEAR
jgi:hypothetical protein